MSYLTVVYIRHGHKEYSNSKGPVGKPKHDPGIKKETYDQIIQRGKRLVELYGAPTQCVVSPYLRTRQTGSLLTSTTDVKQLHVDRNISEFLGFQQPDLINGKLSYTPDVYPETSRFNCPPIGGSFDELYDRCREHIALFELDKLLPNQNPPVSESSIVWNVSHGIVIASIYQLLEETYGKEFTFMSHSTKTPWGSRGPDELNGFVLCGVYGKGAYITKLGN